MDTQSESSKTKQVAVQAFVTRQFKVGKNEGVAQGEEETIAVHRFCTEPAKIEVSLGLTLNLGNYESARLSVGITVPCYKEESEAAFEFAKDWVAQKIQKEVDNIREKKDVSII